MDTTNEVHRAKLDAQLLTIFSVLTHMWKEDS